MAEIIDRREIGHYVVEIHEDDSMWGTGYYHSRDCENVGRLSVPGERDGWYFQDDRSTYREIREQEGEPILALPLDIIDGPYTIVRVSHSWDGADAFYWAPLSRADEWQGDVAALRACMVAEVETLNAELAGDVVGFVVTRGGEHVASCWGFVGCQDDAMAEGVAVAEWHTYNDACVWAALPEWVKHAVLIRGDEWETYPPVPKVLT